MTTEERLAKVERELAALRAELAHSLTTRVVSIVDEQGKIRAGLDVDEDGPSLRLYDEAGKVRAALSVNTDGAGRADAEVMDPRKLPRLPLGGGLWKYSDAEGIHARQQYEESTDDGIGEYGRTREDQG